MNRKEALKVIVDALKGDELLISANGMISRDLCAIQDSSANFYMLGSMGLASSIGLGLALSCKRKRVVVLDGDGNILMNLGSLATIGNLKPRRLLHIVLDNESCDSTGGQPTSSITTKIDQVAKAAGYRRSEKVSSEEKLRKTLTESSKLSGPSMILVKIERAPNTSKRVPYEPEQISERFRRIVFESE